MTGKTSAIWELGASAGLRGAVAAALLVGLALTPAHAFQSDRERKSYRVGEFVLEYALDHPSHVSLDEVLELEVGLRSTERGFVAPRPVDRTYRMKLDSIPEDSRFYPSALQHINWFIVLSFSRLGIDGVFITVPDIEPGTGRDLREPGNTSLRLRIWTGRIADIATLADGARFDELTVEQRTNHPAHEWILALSRCSPVETGTCCGWTSSMTSPSR